MRPNHRYTQVATALQQRIEAGVYPRGSRLPGVRRLASELAVSITTVLEALQRLNEQGWVYSRARSGYFVLGPPQAPMPRASEPSIGPAPVSGPVCVLDLVRAVNDPAVIQFGAAVPHPSLLPRQALARAMAAAYREAPDACTTYCFPPGAPRLRQALARRLSGFGLVVSPEALLVTAGAQEAITLALRVLTMPGDVVAVESPTYYGLLQALEMLGLQALEIPTDPQQGLNLDVLGFSLEQWPVRACVVSTNFSNPLGCTLSDDAKRALVTLLARHGVPLIEDDVYGDLPHCGRRPSAAKQFDSEGDVLYCGSYSKSLAPGMRIGWIAPGRHFAEIEALKYTTTLAAPSAPQLALAALLERGTYERHLRDVRAAYARSVGRLAQAIEGAFPADTRITRPRGGFLLWVELPRAVDTVALYRQVRGEGISIAPGPLFSAAGKFRNCLRLNAAIPWTAAVERAVYRLARAIDKQLGTADH